MNSKNSGNSENREPVAGRCRIVLCVPALPQAGRQLEEALQAGDVASIIILRGEMDDVAYQEHCSGLVRVAQAQDVAALVVDDTRAMGRVNADGIYFSSGGNDPRELIARFSTHKIAGCGGIKDRHRALEIGDANPHFVFFGKPDGDIRPQAHPKNLALAQWWSEMIEIPCIVMGGSSLETVVECAASGAEFVGLGLAVFSHTDGPGAAVGEANRLLDEHAPFSPIPNSASLLCALVILAGTAMQASAQDTSGGVAPSVPSALAISEFDPRADAAYGAFQRGYYLTAFELALERAKNGDAAAQTLIAEMYDKGLGIALDPKEATAWYGLAAESGNPDAQFAYAIKLIEGNHVKKDMAKARVYLQKAAEAGIIVANFNLAQMIVEASGGQSGFAEALPYYRKAAEGNVADAMYAMAQIYGEGLGVEKDDAVAFQWMEKAARAGIDTAQVELGIWLANGRGSAKDEKAALGWMQRAARSGNAIAQNRLAKMYALGIGTQKNAAEAGKWHIIAQRAGLDDPWLSEFIARLDPVERNKALADANRWPGG